MQERSRRAPIYIFVIDILNCYYPTFLRSLILYAALLLPQKFSFLLADYLRNLKIFKAVLCIHFLYVGNRVPSQAKKQNISAKKHPNSLKNFKCTESLRACATCSMCTLDIYNAWKRFIISRRRLGLKNFEFQDRTIQGLSTSWLLLGLKSESLDQFGFFFRLLFHNNDLAYFGFFLIHSWLRAYARESNSLEV